jgi:hypothetical protein
MHLVKKLKKKYFELKVGSNGGILDKIILKIKFFLFKTFKIDVSNPLMPVAGFSNTCVNTDTKFCCMTDGCNSMTFFILQSLFLRYK